MLSSVPLAVLAVGATFAANGVVIGAWAVRVVDIQSSHDLSDAGLGLALICVGVGAIPAMPAMAALSARRGSVACIRFIVCVLALGPVLAASAPGIPLLLVGLAALGAGNGGLDVGMNTQAVALERQRARPVMSSLHAIFSIGFLVSALAGGLVAAAGVSAGVHLGAVGALAAATVLVSSRWLIADRPGGEEQVVGLRWPTRRLLVLGVLSFCALFTEGAIADWGSVYITDVLSGSPVLAGAAAAGFGCGMAVSRLLGDRLRARFGPVALVAVGGALIAAGMLVTVLSGSSAAIVPCFAIVGLGLGNCFPIALAAAGQATKDLSPAGAVSAVSTLAYTGFLLGPALIGFVSQATSLPAAFGLVVLGALIVVSLARAVQPAAAGWAPGD